MIEDKKKGFIGENLLFRKFSFAKCGILIMVKLVLQKSEKLSSADFSKSWVHLES